MSNSSLFKFLMFQCPNFRYQNMSKHSPREKTHLHLTPKDFFLKQFLNQIVICILIHFCTVINIFCTVFVIGRQNASFLFKNVYIPLRQLTLFLRSCLKNNERFH